MVGVQATGSSPEAAGQGGGPRCISHEDRLHYCCGFMMRFARWWRWLFGPLPVVALANHGPDTATQTPEKRPLEQLRAESGALRVRGPTFHRRRPPVGHLRTPRLKRASQSLNEAAI
jgi:hypothetical protein